MSGNPQGKGSGQGLPFDLGRTASNYQRIPEGGRDPGEPWWGRARYRQVRDGLIEQFRDEAHDPQVWRVHIATGEGGGYVSLVRCGRCDHRVLIHRFPLSWVRYKQRACVPVSVEEHERNIEATKRSEAQGLRWLYAIGTAIFGGMFSLFTVANYRSWLSGTGVVAIVMIAIAAYLLTRVLIEMRRNRRRRADPFGPGR